MAWRRDPTGVEEQGTFTRVPQEPGRSCRFRRRVRGVRGVPVIHTRPLALVACRQLERTDKRTEAVPPSEGNEAKREGRQDVGSSHRTAEAGEFRPSGDPVEERG